MLNSWLFSGFASSLCFAGMVLVYKKLLTMGIKPLVLNLFLFGFVFIGFSIWNFTARTRFDLSKRMLALLLLAAVFSLLGNFFDVNAVKNAPNPGFATTIKSSQIVLITILAPILFGSSLSLSTGLGTVLVVLGIFMITV